MLWGGSRSVLDRGTRAQVTPSSQWNISHKGSTFYDPGCFFCVCLAVSVPWQISMTTHQSENVTSLRSIPTHYIECAPSLHSCLSVQQLRAVSRFQSYLEAGITFSFSCHCLLFHVPSTYFSWTTDRWIDWSTQVQLVNWMDILANR